MTCTTEHEILPLGPPHKTNQQQANLKEMLLQSFAMPRSHTEEGATIILAIIAEYK